MVRNSQLLDILIRKILTGHEGEKYYVGVNLKYNLKKKMFLEEEKNK